MNGTLAAAVRQARGVLLEDIQRWTPELDPQVRSTLWHGVVAKAIAETERLFELCAQAAVDAAGAAGDVAASDVSKGKPLERLTMGERMEVIKTLDRQRMIVNGARLLSRGDQKILEAVVNRRNHFIHRRLTPEQGAEYALEFLELVRRFCEINLVVGAAAKLTT